MINLSKSLMLSLSLLASAVSAGNIHVLVSPDGKTPHEALREVRELRRLHKVGENDTVFIDLQDGIYHLGETLLLRPEDSGTPTSPTVIRARREGRAVLSGGMQVEMQPRQDMLGWWSCKPVVGRHSLSVRQLWHRDQKVPHASLVPLDQMIEMTDFRKDTREIVIPRSSFQPVLDLVEAVRLGFDDDAENVAHLKQQELSNLEMIVHQRWAIAILRVKDYVVDGDVVRLTFYDPESRLEFEHPWPQPVIREDRGDGVRRTSSFNLLGGYSLLTPGTWYQDNATAEIFYYPTDAEQGTADASWRRFNVPVLHQLVEVSGSLERPVHDIRFEGVSFEHAAWTRPSEQGHVTLQGGMYLLDAYKLDVPGLPEKAYLENQAWIERPKAAVTVRGGRHIDFVGCSFRHLGATGLDYVWADSACVVRGCHFEDIGGTALALGAFPDRGFETHVPFRPVNMQELCSDIRIEGNLIEDCTNEDWGCVGIGAGYVADVMICDNELRELNYSGICVGWGWTPLNSGMRNNHILRNKVHHFAKMLYDAGGIYTLSYQPGSSIEDNQLTDIYPPRYQTNLRGFYIYLDEATDGYTIRGNVCTEPLFGDNRPGPDVHWGDNTFLKPSSTRLRHSNR